MEALFAERPSIMWASSRWFFVGIVGGALAGWLAAGGNGLSNSKLVGLAIGGFVGAVISAFIGAQWMTAVLRPYFRRVLEERNDEIARIP